MNDRFYDGGGGGRAVGVVGRWRTACPVDGTIPWLGGKRYGVGGGAGRRGGPVATDGWGAAVQWRQRWQRWRRRIRKERWNDGCGGAATVGEGGA